MTENSRQRFIGAHTIDNGGIDMAARRAGMAGMTALQVFTAPPRFYGDKASIKPDRVARFRRAVDEAGIELRNVLVHGAYVLGVATPEPDKWVRASGGLTRELERSTALGAGNVCFHPGSAGSSDIAGAAERVGMAITAALEAVKGDTRVLVENTAGAGTTVGRTAAEISLILSHVPQVLRGRTGYGLDTCHLFSSGYDISRSESHFRSILDEFDDAIGEPPRFFHLNDSDGELGSNRDRHALIGRGRIGAEPFRWLLHDHRSAGIPLILETPQQHPDIDGDDPSPDPWDLQMIEICRAMLG
jgi:deoxyribonuclease-4